jgi:hypothetical protein
VSLLNDDILHRLLLEGRLPAFGTAWWRLYDFTPPTMPAAEQIQLGYFPWFTDPEFSIRLFRPLSSATLTLDHLLFGRSAWPAHVHSLLWFAALTWLASSLYARWFNRRAALLSTAIFAVAGLHGIPLAWVAARHALVAATFAALSLGCLVRSREGFRAGRPLAMAAAIASLCASELGLGTLVFAVCFEFGAEATLRERIRRSGPWVVLGLAYLAMYASLGLGARASGGYVSPFSEPLEFALIALRRVPLLGAELFGAVPSMLATDLRGEWRLFAIGCAAALFVFSVLFTLRRDLGREEKRTLSWLAPATLLSVVPAVGTVLGGRVLPIAMLGGAALVGNAMALALGARRSPHVRRAWPYVLAVAALVALHFGLSPLVRVAVPLVFARIGAAERTLARTADLGACSRRGYVYILTGSDPGVSLYAAGAIAFYAPEKVADRRFRVLSMAPNPERLVRTGPSSFELQVLPPRRANLFEELFRPSSAPLRTGDRVRAGELTVELLEVTNGLFERARFEVDGGLDAACALTLHGGELKVLPWPDANGSVLIPHQPGPMDL